MVDFTPDLKIQVHEQGAVGIICAAFRSHESGQPEWLKNASDVYRRLDLPKDESIILFLFRNGTPTRPSVVGCIDFGGMTTADIETKFRIWADPDASLADDGTATEGGHGNGGKCYMTQLFTSHSLTHTVKDGRGNRYGFVGGNPQSGYFPNNKEGRGYVVSNTRRELENVLQEFDLSISALPNDALEALKRSDGFTAVMGFGAKGYEHRKVPAKQWLENLQGHQQAKAAIEQNRVFVFSSGKALNNGSELSLPKIEPLDAAPLPHEIAVPKQLPNPDENGEMLDTGSVEGSKLVLRTSKKQMTHSLKSRHTIHGSTLAGRTTGYWEVRELSRAAYSYHIYGELILDSLDEYRQNDRKHHSSSPLIAAIQTWLSEQIDEYSSDFVKIDRLQATEEEKDELRRLNEMLDHWKNEYLQNEFGLGGQGGEQSGPKPKPNPLPSGTPARVEISLTHHRAGQGVSLKPGYQFFDMNENRIKPVPFEWDSSDHAVATFDENLNILNTHAPGTIFLSLKCKGLPIRSNELQLEVLDIAEIHLSPLEVVVGVGRRKSIDARVSTQDGRVLEGVNLIWAEGDSNKIEVSASGSVFGLALGESSVSAGDDQCIAEHEAVVQVVENEDLGEDSGGGGFPQILLSEIQPDPGSGEIPQFSASEPPVHQRPIDFERNIWWINMASPLARRHLDAARGGGSNSAEWRAYMIERYIETLVKIMLTIDFEHGEELTFETMLRRWDEEAAAWQQRVSESLSKFLDGIDISEEIAA